VNSKKNNQATAKTVNARNPAKPTLRLIQGGGETTPRARTRADDALHALTLEVFSPDRAVASRAFGTLAALVQKEAERVLARRLRLSRDRANHDNRVLECGLAILEKKFPPNDLGFAASLRDSITPYAFLNKCIRNFVSGFLRSPSPVAKVFSDHEVEPDPEDPGPSPEAAVLDHEEQLDEEAAAVRALSGLSAAERLLLDLAFLDPEEIPDDRLALLAARRGLSVAGLRDELARAREGCDGRRAERSAKVESLASKLHQLRLHRDRLAVFSRDLGDDPGGPPLRVEGGQAHDLAYSRSAFQSAEPGERRACLRYLDARIEQGGLHLAEARRAVKRSAVRPDHESLARLLGLIGPSSSLEEVARAANTMNQRLRRLLERLRADR